MTTRPSRIAVLTVEWRLCHWTYKGKVAWWERVARQRFGERVRADSPAFVCKHDRLGRIRKAYSIRRGLPFGWWGSWVTVRFPFLVVLLQNAASSDLPGSALSFAYQLPLLIFCVPWIRNLTMILDRSSGGQKSLIRKRHSVHWRFSPIVPDSKQVCQILT